MNNLITLTKDNIDTEHICCAFSDVKCSEGYQLKKDWLKQEFKNGYVFRRLDERAKVFMEYGPAEYGWAPVYAPGYLLMNCFWVSGQYKGNGYAKELLRLALEDAISQKKKGLVTVVGTKKFHFMSDTKWLLKQGFETVETTPSGFSLLVRKIDPNAENPHFNEQAMRFRIDHTNGLVVYYSNRCPYTEFYVNTSLKETAAKKHLSLTIIKIQNREQAQECPTPATIFSLFYDGKFITTDVSVCLENRFDKILNKAIQ
jgi:hypothetical protein